jgi:hypothetical protein
MLAFWSLISLAIRTIAIGLFSFVLKRQWLEFAKPNNFKTEGRLKRLLFSMILFNMVSNIPIMYLHYIRIRNINVSEAITSVATVFNALSMLVVAIIAILIYTNKDLQD